MLCSCLASPPARLQEWSSPSNQSTTQTPRITTTFPTGGLVAVFIGATSFARVISVATGRHEGPIDPIDLDMTNISLLRPLKPRGQAASIVMLTLDHIAQRAPQVLFIHSRPGPVYSKIDRTMTGFLIPLKWLIRFLMLFKSQSAAESGSGTYFWRRVRGGLRRGVWLKESGCLRGVG